MESYHVTHVPHISICLCLYPFSIPFKNTYTLSGLRYILTHRSVLSSLILVHTRKKSLPHLPLPIKLHSWHSILSSLSRYISHLLTATMMAHTLVSFTPSSFVCLFVCMCHTCMCEPTNNRSWHVPSARGANLNSFRARGLHPYVKPTLFPDLVYPC